MKRKLNEHDVPEVTVEHTSSKSTVHDSFSTLGLDHRLLQAVSQEQFAAPTPVQRRVIPIATAGQDVLARAKTGTGKTLAYLLPILNAILRRKAADKRTKSTTVLILVPTKELATQVAATIVTFSAFCAQEIKCENITRKEDAAVTRARLAQEPDVVIATPSRATQWMNNELLKTSQLKHLVIDEADLILSYGHEDDLRTIAKATSSGVQKIMMSATLRTDGDTLSSLFFSSGDDAGPTVIDLSQEESEEQQKLSQYIVRSAEDEKFLLIYAIFKLRLIKGKVIIFVADIDRCYRVKLFLEQFGIRACVLNSELPVNSRLHVVEEFNRGVYDIIIAADEGEVVGNENSVKKQKSLETEQSAADPDADDVQVDDDDAEVPDEAEQDDQAEQPTSSATAPAPKKRRKDGRNARQDREYGVSRGIDFRHVTCVLNFDMPSTSKSYVHRIGRTARAGQTGMALTFYVPSELYRKHKPTSIPQCENDEKVLAKIKTKQAQKGAEIKEWELDWKKLEGFRYRLADALRSVTRIAVREARARELREELIKSEKLKRHFEENPEDLRHLRHDTASHVVRQQAHLKHVPSYLLPSGGKTAITKDVGFVGMKRDKENRIRKARAFNKGRGKGRIAKTKGLDPLRSLNVKGRSKK